jgi:aspartate/methionine/tyrosine aminotransferase
VYRELEHDPATRLPAASDLSARGVSLGSVSKTYGLPGLRLGWLATRDRDTIQKCLEFKYYTTICNSAPSEFLTALALRHREALVSRNRQLVERNLPLLDRFIQQRPNLLRWVKPNAGPIGFVRYQAARDAYGFCEKLVRDAGVLLLPGSVYDEPEFIRVGYGRSNMPEALEKLGQYLDKQR